jgi:hypothetical protein
MIQKMKKYSIQILLLLEILVIISNIFYPITFFIDESRGYQATGVSFL